MERSMHELVEVSKVIGAMPVGALITVVVLGGFALAAYAIYAVMVIAKKERSDGPT
jgi:hypothetical protein